MASALERVKARNYDVMVRYHPVARHIERLDPRAEWTVLDVGCGAGGLAPFIRGRRLAGVDTARPAGGAIPLQFCLASATQLPFADGAWDIVTCIDVLEHLPPALRSRALGEIVRVARRAVIVAAPVGHAARSADESMHRAYASSSQRPPEWLLEHLEHSPIDAAELASEIERASSAARPTECRVFYNESLTLQRLHRRLARTTRLGYKLFSVACTIVIGALARPIDAAGAYRCFVIAERPAAENASAARRA